MSLERRNKIAKCPACLNQYDSFDELGFHMIDSHRDLSAALLSDYMINRAAKAMRSKAE